MRNSWFLFFVLFALFSSPALYGWIHYKNQLSERQVELKIPNSLRSVASASSHENNNCQWKSLWRYRCDEQQKNCRRESRQFYQFCQSSTP